MKRWFWLILLLTWYSPPSALAYNVDDEWQAISMITNLPDVTYPVDPRSVFFPAMHTYGQGLKVDARFLHSTPARLVALRKHPARLFDLFQARIKQLSHGDTLMALVNIESMDFLMLSFYGPPQRMELAHRIITMHSSTYYLNRGQ